MEVETFRFSENGWVPNNPRVPVLLYRGTFEDEGREANAATFESLFADNHWPAQWRDTIYDYHHYHSTAHEVLGVASGRAILALGGPHSTIVEVRAGDTLILPVGTGHCRQSTTKDFYVVGVTLPVRIGIFADLRRRAKWWFGWTRLSFRTAIPWPEYKVRS